MLPIMIWLANAALVASIFMPFSTTPASVSRVTRSAGIFRPELS